MFKVIFIILYFDNISVYFLLFSSTQLTENNSLGYDQHEQRHVRITPTVLKAGFLP